MTDPLSFGVSVVALLAVPGPTNTLLFAAGATVGLRRAAHLLSAELLAYNVAIYALVGLFNQLSSSHRWADIAVRVVAAMYLFVLAAKLWKYRWEVGNTPIAWRNVLATTLMNPKTIVFALLVFPPNSPDPARYFAEFSVLTVIIGAVWMTLGHLVGATGGGAVRRTIPRVSSAVLMTFGVILLASLGTK